MFVVYNMNQRLSHLNVDGVMLNLVSGWERQFEPVGLFGMPQSVAWRYIELMNEPELWVFCCFKQIFVLIGSTFSVFFSGFVHHARRRTFKCELWSMDRKDQPINMKMISGVFIWLMKNQIVFICNDIMYFIV